jgi:hypothetical protein
MMVVVVFEAQVAHVLTRDVSSSGPQHFGAAFSL